MSSLHVPMRHCGAISTAGQVLGAVPLVVWVACGVNTKAWVVVDEVVHSPRLEAVVEVAGTVSNMETIADMASRVVEVSVVAVAAGASSAATTIRKTDQHKRHGVTNARYVYACSHVRCARVWRETLVELNQIQST